METLLQAQIREMFRDPIHFEKLPQFSVLYLLRRDIDSAFDYDRKNPFRNPEVRALFLGISGLLTGIDLMSKFASGNLTRNHVGGRYRSYLQTYFENCDAATANVLYEFRNAIIHTYGLYTDNYTFQIGFKYNPTALPSVFQYVHQVAGSEYAVYGFDLLYAFDRSLERYAVALENDSTLQHNFQRAFAVFGMTGISWN
jgi:hypothetical protein